MDMNKTTIEWVVNPDGTQGYTWNPITGCLNSCLYCYARKIANRFQGNFKPTFHEKRINDIFKLRKPSTVFVGSMSDTLGEWVELEWIDMILQVTKIFPEHRFLFLTKNPNRYTKLKFPDNCFKGQTITGGRIKNFSFVFTGTDFISAEPLLEELYLPEDQLKWLIIGALSVNGKPQTTKKEWILSLIEQADSKRIPVFIKNSLYELYPELPKRRDLPYLRLNKNPSRRGIET